MPPKPQKRPSPQRQTTIDQFVKKPTTSQHHAPDTAILARQSEPTLEGISLDVEIVGETSGTHVEQEAELQLQEVEQPEAEAEGNPICEFDIGLIAKSSKTSVLHKINTLTQYPVPDQATLNQFPQVLAGQKK
jgi:hypothetical protein